MYGPLPGFHIIWKVIGETPRNMTAVAVSINSLPWLLGAEEEDASKFYESVDLVL